MFEELILPKIVAIGVFDATVRFKDLRETVSRGVSFFEIDLVTENGGMAFVDGKSFPMCFDENGFASLSVNGSNGEVKLSFTKAKGAFFPRFKAVKVR
jgi:hypothetical protein